jgi:iron complex transport system substrate-binding protein
MKRLALVPTLLCTSLALGTSLTLASLGTALLIPSGATAAEVTDATGRTVTIPDHPERVLPAGPPAGVLLAAIAPGQMLGFPGPPGDLARTALAPAASSLPTVPRVTGHPDATPALHDLRPDLIIDYGSVAPRYRQLAVETQQKTGIPTLLFDGALDQIPSVTRTLGKILHQPEQAEAVARFAEAILALPVAPDTHPRVLYARGADGLLAAAPGTDVTAVFTRLGWQVVAPESPPGSAKPAGAFRPATIDEIHKLDPDIIILSDPAAKAVLTTEAWASLRAVRDGYAYIAPSVPFGWIEEPPSINRLLGLAWLRGGDPLTLAALFNATVYGKALTQDQVLAIAGSTPTLTSPTLPASPKP